MFTNLPPITRNILEHNKQGFSDLVTSEQSEYLRCSFNMDKIPSLTNEKEASDLLRHAIDTKMHVLVCSDFDCDGLSGAAVGYHGLKLAGANYEIIHNKRINGNGFTDGFVKTILEIHAVRPVDLIITCDHGSGSNCWPAYKVLKKHGIKKIVITDHHTIGEGDQSAVDVIVNPQQNIKDDPIGLSGCATFFKVLANLFTTDESKAEYYRKCLPYAAITTVSDVMPLDIPYNRMIVRAGLQLMNSSDGLWGRLANALGLPGAYSYKSIGYVIAPYINTGNRTSKEELFYKILTDPTDEDIKEGIKLNTSRKRVRADAMRLAMDSLEGMPVGKSLSIIVDTPMAINGIIANNLGEAYRVPTTCFMVVGDGSRLAGSARGVLKEMHIADMFKEMAAIDDSLFISSGGHSGAGGCNIHRDKFNRFKELFELVASKIKTVKEVVDRRYIIDINTKYLNHGIVEEVDYAGPYGKNWEFPLFRGKFKIKGVIALGNMAIVTMVTAGGMDIKGTYFYKDSDTKSNIEYALERNTVVELIFEPQFYKRYQRINFTILIDEFKIAI